LRAWKADLYDSNSGVQFEMGLRVIERLKIKDGERILDIGCGTGRLTFEIAKKNPSGSVTGIDITENMIKKAKENLVLTGLKNVTFFNEDILKYTPKKKFDAIFSNSALHWIPDSKALFKKISKCLLPNGRISAQVAAKGGISKYMTLLFSPVQPLNLSEYFRNWRFPIRQFNPNGLKRLLEKNGFSEVDIKKFAQTIEFDKHDSLITFLKTGPLVPILSQIPVEKRNSYLKYLLQVFQSEGDAILKITINRLLFCAKK